jgi:DNA processing protein
MPESGVIPVYEHMFDEEDAMDLTEEHLSLLALCRIPGVKYELIAREVLRTGATAGILRGEFGERTRAATDARLLIEAASETLEERRDWVREQHELAGPAGARLVTVLDKDYPENLRLIVNLPPFLYVLGELRPEDVRSVAVVGTRGASPEGRSTADRMARLLTEQGVTVVSGMARGIDTVAHEAALDLGGRTLAVMGTGILQRYPKENADLADRIQANGALISQFWPSSPPGRHSFPIRNVVTSGISQGTVVIEASSTSGAKMQARLAIEHGKRVFLLESLVTDQKWAQDYVKKYGRLVTVVREVDDVLSRLRSPQQVEELTTQRRQLTFDLA